MQRERRASKLLAFVLFIVLIIVSANLWLPLVGGFLVIPDTVQKADCIVPLQGDLYPRFQKAVSLYRQGYADNIVVSVLPEHKEDSTDNDVVTFRIYGCPLLPQREFALKAFGYFGKDPQGIYFTEGGVTSTYEEALATKKLLRQKGFTSMILVTSAFHSRRARLLFEQVFRGSGITIYYSLAHDGTFNPRRWWYGEGGVRLVIQEYLAMAHNIVYHLIMGKVRTSFDK